MLVRNPGTFYLDFSAMVHDGHSSYHGQILASKEEGMQIMLFFQASQKFHTPLPLTFLSLITTHAREM